MDYFLTWGRTPWGQQILTHVSWSLFWASLFAGLMFLVAHASYMLLSAHHKRASAETDALEAKRKDLPEKIPRHSLVARVIARYLGADTTEASEYKIVLPADTAPHEVQILPALPDTTGRDTLPRDTLPRDTLPRDTTHVQPRSRTR